MREHYMTRRFGRWMQRLRREWTKNDGKPWEEWAAGRDLKEVVAISLLCVLFIALAMLTGMMLFGRP